MLELLRAQTLGLAARVRELAVANGEAKLGVRRAAAQQAELVTALGAAALELGPQLLLVALSLRHLARMTHLELCQSAAMLAL
mmetsp:Transcript_15407/g.39095  ORF Transcript_15407/g.39095 Transcript_15407/m.39095 type:complete len:83 (+) Transcript_15407:2193-2441(+)